MVTTDAGCSARRRSSPTTGEIASGWKVWLIPFAHDVVAAGTITNANTRNVPNIGNAGAIYNIGGIWTGTVEGNAGTISNAPDEINHVMSGPSTWIGNVLSNAGNI